MVISIRRSQHEEGKIIAISCRSVDATHDFISRVSGRAGRAGSFLLPEALWSRLMNGISRLGLCC